MILSTIKKVLNLLSSGDRIKFSIICCIMVVVSIAEALTLTLFFPFLLIISSDDSILSNEWARRAYEELQLDSILHFKIVSAFVLIAVILLSTCIKLIGHYSVSRYSNLRTYVISGQVFEKVLNSDYSWILDKSTAQSLRMIASTITSVVERVLLSMGYLAGSISLVILIFIVLIVINPLIAFLSAGVLSLAYVTIYMGAQRALARGGQQILEADRRRYAILQEALSGFKLVKTMGLEENYVHRFRVASLQLARAKTTNQIISIMPKSIVEGITLLSIVGVIMYLLLNMGGEIENVVPTLGILAVAAFRILPALQNSYYYLSQIRSGLASLDDLTSFHAEIAASAPPPVPAGESGERIDLRHRLQLKSISYSYRKSIRPTLHDISATINFGEMVAFVGGTGAGKSTLIDIILGLLLPDSGQVIVDGRAITQANCRAWQRSIGYVPQTIFLSNSSVAANIAFGVPPDRIDMDKVVAAARLACLHDFVMRDLPLGYQTIVGEAGVRLSGGQRQRIGIARALYTDPSLLMFDEATSALDTLTEAAVMDAVRAIGRSKTIIMVAHRLSTVRTCDRLYLMERGRIIASGTFDELIETSDIFRRMAAPVDLERSAGA